MRGAIIHSFIHACMITYVCACVCVRACAYLSHLAVVIIVVSQEFRQEIEFLETIRHNNVVYFFGYAACAIIVVPFFNSIVVFILAY